MLGLVGSQAMVVDIIPESDNKRISVVDLVEVTSIVGSITNVNAHLINTIQ